MDAIFSFLLMGLGYGATWEAVLVLVLFGVWCEHGSSRGWAIFWGLGATVAAYFAFQIPLLYIAYGMVAYVLAGVLWSFYRYKRYVADKVAGAGKLDEYAKNALIRDMHPQAMLGTITAWIIIWPFSLIDNFIGDIITGIETLVRTVFRSVYHRIYDSAVAQLNVAAK